MSGNQKRRPQLSPFAAAEDLYDLIAENGGGVFTNEQLSELYLARCRDLNRDPARESLVRMELLDFKGVYKDVERDEAGRRKTIWIIRPISK